MIASLKTRSAPSLTLPLTLQQHLRWQRLPLFPLPAGPRRALSKCHVLQEMQWCRQSTPTRTAQQAQPSCGVLPLMLGTCAQAWVAVFVSQLSWKTLRSCIAAARSR